MHAKTLPTDSYGVGMGNKPEMTATISHYDNLGTVSAADSHLPMMLQSSLKVGASPATPASLPYWFNMPFCAARGSGIVSVIGRWNLRRRGSIVMIGLTATRLQSILDTRFGGTGCAWIAMHHSLKRYCILVQGYQCHHDQHHKCQQQMHCYVSILFTNSHYFCTMPSISLNPLKPNSPNCYTMPCTPNLSFSTSDIRALWRSALSATVPERQNLKMVG